MHSDARVLGKFRVNLVRDQVQGSLAFEEVRGQSCIGFVHPGTKAKAPGDQNPWRELCLAAFHGYVFKAVGHTATLELPCRTEAEFQEPGTQKFACPLELQSIP